MTIFGLFRIVLVYEKVSAEIEHRLGLLKSKQDDSRLQTVRSRMIYRYVNNIYNVM